MPINNDLNNNLNLLPKYGSSESTINKSYCLESEYNQKHLNCITKFLRKILAAKAYSHMLKNGDRFSRYPIDLLDRRINNPFAMLDSMDRISKFFLQQIKSRVMPLNQKEIDLIELIINQEWHFRHQTNADVDLKNLTIYSNKLIQALNVNVETMTKKDDEIYLANTDFVFFGVEYSGNLSEMPLNTEFNRDDFGANAYIISEYHPQAQNGFLTLTDHLDSYVAVSRKHKNNFSKRFSIAAEEAERDIGCGFGKNHSPMFSRRDMKMGLSLHLIEFIRNSKDKEFVDFIYTEGSENSNLDYILNFVMQAEYHIPRLLSSNDYYKKSHRPMTLDEAICSNNLRELMHLTNTKDLALEALMLAIYEGKGDLALGLCNKWDFTKAEVLSQSSKYSQHLIEMLIINNNSIQSLELFIKKGFIDKAMKNKSGEDIFEIASRSKKTEMIDFLSSFK